MFNETLAKVASQLVAYCRENKEDQCLTELYAADAVSVEAVAMPGTSSAECVGLDAIRGKHAWWENTMEIHSGNVEGPFLHGADRFAVIFEVDATNRETKERNQMREVGVYTVKDGKIVREEFFDSC